MILDMTMFKFGIMLTSCYYSIQSLKMMNEYNYGRTIVNPYVYVFLYVGHVVTTCVYINISYDLISNIK